MIVKVLPLPISVTNDVKNSRRDIFYSKLCQTTSVTKMSCTRDGRFALDCPIVLIHKVAYLALTCCGWYGLSYGAGHYYT